MENIERTALIVEIIEKHLPKGFNIDELAQQVGISKWHLQREFKLATGFSPAQYTRYRQLCKAAAEVSSSGKRILDIALEYQFESQEAFARAFKRHFHLSPKQLKGQVNWGPRFDYFQITRPYLEAYPLLKNIEPELVQLEDLSLVAIRTKMLPLVGNEAQLFDELDRTWTRFGKETQHWPGAERSWYTLEYRPLCKIKNDEFAMLASCDALGSDPHNPDLIYLSLPGRQYHKFLIPEQKLIATFLVWLHSEYLPKHNLGIVYDPVIWKMLESGQLECFIRLSDWNNVLKPSCLNVQDKLLTLPSSSPALTFQQIPHKNHTIGQRLSFVISSWLEKHADTCKRSATNHATGKNEKGSGPANLNLINLFASNNAVLLGEPADSPFCPDHEYHSYIATLDTSSDDIIESSDYLDCQLSGTPSQMAEAIEYLHYWYLPQSLWYRYSGYEWLVNIEKGKEEGSYHARYLLPVKKRGGVPR